VRRCLAKVGRAFYTDTTVCLFITATLPAEARWERVEPVLARHALRWKALENTSLKEALAGDHYYLTTRGHCDCDTALGSLGGRISGPRRQTVAGAAGRDPEVAKLRKRGWGEAKIRRWLEQRAQAAANWTRAEAVRAETRGTEIREAGGTGEAQRWLETIRELLGGDGEGGRAGEGGARVKHVGLLLHQYGGGLQNERITLARSETVSAAALELQTLLELQTDVLYRFTR
jgi:hypothetical protein